MAVGSVYVDVVPSTRGFVRDMAKDLEREGDRLGATLGRRIADGVGKNMGRQITEGLPQLADFHKVGDAAEVAGKQAGKRFSQSLINSARQLTADLRNLTNVEARISARLEVNKGALDDVQREIYELGNSRINVDVDIDDSELNRIAEGLHDEQRTLQIKIDADEGRLPAVRKELDLTRGLARDMPDIRFDADYRQVDAAGRSVEKLRRSLVQADDSTQRFMSKPKEYALLATAAFTPASAAVLGFAAAGLAVIAPVAAIAAGIDGIKQAVSPLNSDLQLLQVNVDAAFVKGLAPAVGNVERLFPTLNSGLTGTASALSDVAVRMTSVASSSSNMDLLDGVFRDMNESITGLGPPMATLVDNTLKFAAIGASAMVTIGPILNEVGAAWTDMINTLSSNGAGEAAVVALIQVLGSLLTLAAPLVQLGAEMFQAIGPGLAAGINAVASVVSVLANGFGTLPGPMQTIIATALILRAILGLTGRTMGGLVYSLTQMAGSVNQSLTSPFRAASAAMSAYDARTKATGEQLALFGGRAEEAGRKAADGAKRSSNEMGSFATGATRALDGVANGVLAATYKMEAGYSKTVAAGKTLVSASSTALSAVERGYIRAQLAGEAFSSATGRAVERVGHAFYTLSGAPSKALSTLQAGYEGARRQASFFVDDTQRAMTSVERGYIRAQLAGESFASRTIDAVRNAGSAFVTLAREPAQALPMLERGYIRAQLAGEDFAGRSNAALDRVKQGFAGLTAGPMAAITALSTGMTQGGAGFAQYAVAAEQGSSRARSSLSTLSSSVSSSMSSASSAATSGSSSIRSALSSGFDSAVQTAGRSFSNLSTLVSTGMTRAGSAVRSGASAISTGLSSVATAASRAGVGIAAGFGRAISGIVGALGGPWGAALAGAMVVLSLFGDAAAKSAQKQAELQAATRETASALRESAGAITQNQIDTETLSLIQDGAGKSAQALGINIRDAALAAINGGQNYDQLRARLQETAAAGEATSFSVMATGGALDAAGLATVAMGANAQSLLDKLGPLNAKFAEARAQNEAFKAAIQSGGASMQTGIANAAQLTAAFGLLKDEMSSVEDRAKGLAAALTLLTGGTLPAEAAAAQFRTEIAELGEAFDKAEAAAKKAGVGILDSAGNINQSTQAGRDLVIAMSGVTTSMSQAAASAFDSAGGFTNLQAAGKAAFGVVSQGRADFIRMAEGAGLGAEAARRYADQMGLIPELVVSLLSIRSEGMPQVQQELLQVRSQVQTASAGAVIPLNVSGDALAQLRTIGVEIVQLPEGKVGIKVNDQTAPGIDKILAAIGIIQPQTGPVKLGDTSSLPPGVQSVVGGTSPTTGAVQPGPMGGLPDAILGTAQGTNPVTGPVLPGPTGAVPQAANSAAAGTSPTTGPVQPGSTAPLTQGVQSAVSGLGPQEIAVVLGNVQGIEAGIDRIRQKLSAPITMTLNLQNNIGTGTDAYQALQSKTVTLTLALVDGIGQTAATALAVESKTATLTLALVDGIGTAAATAMAVESKSVTLTLSLVNGIGTAAATAMAVESKTATLTLGLVNNIGDGARSAMAIEDKTVTMTLALTDNIGGTPSERFGQVRDLTVTLTLGLTDNVAGTPTDRFNQVSDKTVTLTLALVDGIGDKARAAFAIESKTVTLTTRYVTQGAPPPPNAAGNIYGYAKGGTYMGHKLTPMAAGIARKVQANSWRVVGDRTSKPESYIPWNNSGRSKALLATTAKAFGYALQPMANGGVASGDTLKIAQLARERIGTQTVGAMQRAQSMTVDKAAAKQQSAQLAEIATLLKEQAAAPRTITVNDRSGNPVETARAANLQFRMSR